LLSHRNHEKNINFLPKFTSQIEELISARKKINAHKNEYHVMEMKYQSWTINMTRV